MQGIGGNIWSRTNADDTFACPVDDRIELEETDKAGSIAA